MATRCDPRHTKNLESMAAMKLGQAAAKLLSKDEARRIAVNREAARAVAQFVLLHRGKGIIDVNLISRVRN
jgi:hypothetical protein